MIENKKLLKTNIIRGFGTLIVREFFLKLLSFVGQIFLARLLFPSDFGTYVSAIFVINFFSLFTDLGLSYAIIQKKEEPTKIELSTVFVIKIFLSLFVIFLIWILSPIARFIYPSFTIENIAMIRMLSIILFAAGVRSVSIALLEREIRYNLISLVDIFGVCMFYIVSLVSAFAHFGVWSLIFGTLASEVTQTIILYFIKPFFPQFTFSKKNIKKMVKFGMYIQGNSLVGVINSSIIPIIGGKIGGLNSVGVLDFAFSIASLPITVANNFSRVAFTGYSRIQNEKKLLHGSICKSISLLSIILYIFPVIILGFSKELIPIVFSSRWTPAIPVLYWYSLGSFLLPVIASFGQGILVIGKSKEIFWAGFLIIVSSWIGALILTNLVGFIGISIIYFLVTISFCLSYIIIFRRAGFIFPIFSLIFLKIFVSLFSLLFAVFLNTVFSNTLQMLIFKIVMTISFYSVCMYMLAKKETVELFIVAVGFFRAKNV